MAIKKKPRFVSDNLEYRLNDYRAREEYVANAAATDRVMASRWKLAEKVRLAIPSCESEEGKRALKFAHDLIVDEIQALAFLKGAQAKLEEPHIAAWIHLNEKVERLSEELDRVSARVPEEPYG